MFGKHIYIYFILIGFLFSDPQLKATTPNLACVAGLTEFAQNALNPAKRYPKILDADNWTTEDWKKLNTEYRARGPAYIFAGDVTAVRNDSHLGILESWEVPVMRGHSMAFSGGESLKVGERSKIDLKKYFQGYYGSIKAHFLNGALSRENEIILPAIPFALKEKIKHAGDAALTDIVWVRPGIDALPDLEKYGYVELDFIPHREWIRLLAMGIMPFSFARIDHDSAHLTGYAQRPSHMKSVRAFYSNSNEAIGDRNNERLIDRNQQIAFSMEELFNFPQPVTENILQLVYGPLLANQAPTSNHLPKLEDFQKALQNLSREQHLLIARNIVQNKYTILEPWGGIERQLGDLSEGGFSFQAWLLIGKDISAELKLTDLQKSSNEIVSQGHLGGKVEEIRSLLLAETSPTSFANIISRSVLAVPQNEKALSATIEPLLATYQKDPKAYENAVDQVLIRELARFQYAYMLAVHHQLSPETFATEPVIFGETNKDKTGEGSSPLMHFLQILLQRNENHQEPSSHP